MLFEGQIPMNSQTNQTVKPEYMRAVKRTLLQQFPVLLLCALLLDSGRTLRLCLIAVLGFWLLSMVFLARGHRQPDAFGLWFIRWGFIPLFAVVCVANQWIHH